MEKNKMHFPIHDTLSITFFDIHSNFVELLRILFITFYAEFFHLFHWLPDLNEVLSLLSEFPDRNRLTVLSEMVYLT